MAYAQVTDVSEIAKDDEEIRRKACELAGEDLELDSDSTYITASDFQIMAKNVGAVLVQKTSEIGAFKVTGEGLGNEVITIITGPYETGVVIILIKPRQTAMCFGSPSLRYLYKKNRDP